MLEKHDYLPLSSALPMHGIVVAIAACIVSVVAILALWRVTIRMSRDGGPGAIFVSRDWLIHHRENDHP